jgi:hypothetical protein
MPFKGDLRLGGPHDNEASLNGTSEGPSVPAAGTFIRNESLVRPIADGGSFVSYTSSDNNPLQEPNQTWTVPVKADGIGGEYYDWTTASNPVYLSGGTLPSSTQSTDLYISIGSSTYMNGTSYTQYVHDGSGGYIVTGGSTYTAADSMSPFHYEAGVPHYSEFEGNNYQTGTKSVNYYHDGTGGYTTADQSLSWFSDGTVVGSKNVTTYVYVTEIDTQYPSGGWIYDIELYQQNLSLRSYPAHGTYTPSGTRVADGQPYFHDGAGGYYYSNAGLPTGNTTSQTEYIELSLPYGTSSYENGSSVSTEYYDGTGSTYWESSRTYAPYGHFFTSASYSDEWNTYNYNYFSDGVGGYYTESY